jgi:hypothetical protein
LAGVISTGLLALHASEGRFERAEQCGLDSLATSRGHLDDDSIANKLGNLARDAIALRSDASAREYLRETAAIMGGSGSIGNVQAILTHCAGVAALRSEHILAMRLAGAAEAHREQTGFRLDVPDAPCHERAIEPAREALRMQAADAAFMAGRAMRPEAALADAVAWLEMLTQQVP